MIDIIRLYIFSDSLFQFKYIRFRNKVTNPKIKISVEKIASVRANHLNQIIANLKVIYHDKKKNGSK